jgi:uncharacterized protein YybS (DUF2232 family)
MRISPEFRDLGAAASFSALLFAAGLLVPLLGPAAGFFSAAPLIWVAARHGRTAALLAALLATAVLLPALPPPVVLIFALEHAAPAWFLGGRLRAGRGIVAGSAAAALAVTLLMAGATLLFVARGQDPVQLLEQQLREGLAELGTATGERGAATPPAALDANIEQVLAFVRRVLPAVTLIGIFLECSLNSLLAARLLARGAYAPPPLTLTAFALPEWLVWVLIPVLALCWVPQPTLATAALNALLPLLFAYLLQGLSISLHFAARARITRFGRTLFACAFIFFPWLLALPLLLGVLDFRFGFRQRWPLTSPP